MPGQFTGSEYHDMLVRLDEKLDSISKQVEDVNVRLYGNGKPGIIVDQALQQKQIEQLISTAQINAGNIDKLGKMLHDSVSKLEQLTAPKWLSKNWKWIGIAFVASFLFLHSLLPASVSLWTIISKLLGIGG